MAAVPSGAAATAGERGVSLSACVLQRWRHSMGSHCRSHDCLPKYCLCGSSLRTSDTGSPNTHYLGRVRSPRTIGPGKPGPAVARKTNRQDQRWQLNKCGSSSTSVLPEPAHFHVNAARNKLPFGAPSGHPVRPFGCRFGSKADISRCRRHVRFASDCDRKSRHRLTGRMLLSSTEEYEPCKTMQTAILTPKRAPWNTRLGNSQHAPK